MTIFRFAKGNKHIVLLSAFIAVVFSACSTLGTPFMNQARDSYRADKPAEALRLVSESLLADPGYDPPKAFLRDNFEEANQKITAILSATSTSSSPSDLMKRFDIYSDLNAFYKNLSKIGLPLFAEKKLFGLIKSWSWTTEIKNFDAEVSKSRTAAYNAFMKSGDNQLKAGKIKEAAADYTQVTVKLAKNAEESAKDKKAIAVKMTSWADGNAKSASRDVLLNALDAYSTALQFDSSNAAADAGKKAVSIRIADSYAASALAEEKKGTIESFTAAIDLYKKAQAYNSADARFAEGISRSKEGIAALHYGTGARIVNAALASGRLTKEDAAVAIASFSEANKWVPSFRDSDLNIARLNAASQLITMTDSVAAVHSEIGTTAGPISSLASATGKAQAGMDSVNYIADAVVQLNSQMNTISNVASAISPIPVIGTAMSVANTAMGTVHTPVKSVARKVDSIRAPMITPTRDFLAAINDKTQFVSQKMNETVAAVERARQMSQRTVPAALKLQSAEAAKNVEASAKRLASAASEASGMIKTVNSTASSVVGPMNEIANSMNVINKVKGGIKTVMTPLNKIKGVTDSINSVLKKKIKIPLVGEFTVQQAIQSTTGVIKKAAEALLNPLMKELNISFPSIPGIDELDSFMDKFSGYFNTIQQAKADIESAAAKAAAVPAKFITETDTLMQLLSM